MSAMPILFFEHKNSIFWLAIKVSLSCTAQQRQKRSRCYKIAFVYEIHGWFGIGSIWYVVHDGLCTQKVNPQQLTHRSRWIEHAQVFGGCFWDAAEFGATFVWVSQLSKSFPSMAWQFSIKDHGRKCPPWQFFIIQPFHVRNKDGTKVQKLGYLAD